MDYIINTKSPSKHKMSQEGTKESVQYLQKGNKKTTKRMKKEITINHSTTLRGD